MLFLVRPENVSRLDILKHCCLVPIVIRRDAREKFIYNNTKSPPVQCFVMATSIKHFRGHVFWCPTKSVAEVSLLGETKICEFQIAMLIKYYVLWLQVSIYYIKLLMEVTYG